MKSALCQELIEFDACDGYSAGHIQMLLQRADNLTDAVVVLKNAHFLTTKAFGILYEYLKEKGDGGPTFLLHSTEQDKIFPPLLAFLSLN